MTIVLDLRYKHVDTSNVVISVTSPGKYTTGVTSLQKEGCGRLFDDKQKFGVKLTVAGLF